MDVSETPFCAEKLKAPAFFFVWGKDDKQGRVEKKKKKKGGLKVIARDSVRRTSPKIVELDKIE